MIVEHKYISPTYKDGQAMYDAETLDDSPRVRIIDVPSLRTNSFPLHDQLFYDLYRKSSYGYGEELSYFVFFCFPASLSVKTFKEWQTFFFTKVFKENKSIRCLDLPDNDLLPEYHWQQVCQAGEPLCIAASKETPEVMKLMLVIPALTYVYGDSTPFVASADLARDLQTYFLTEVIYGDNA